MSAAITIDDAARAGKTTVASMHARLLGFACLYAGALYRARSQNGI